MLTRRALVLVILAATLSLVVPAGAEEGDYCFDGVPECIPNLQEWSYYGKVMDQLDRPIEGVSVVDVYDRSSKSDPTDSQGKYRLKERALPGDCVPIEVAYNSKVWARQSCDINLGSDVELDFYVWWRTYADVSPYEAQPGDEPLLTIKSYVPEPESLCVIVIRDGWTTREHSVHRATYVSTSSSGLSKWEWKDKVVADDVPSHAYYRLTFYIEDCETRTRMTYETHREYSVP